MKFVLIDQSNGAKTTNGETMTPDVLAHLAQEMNVQMNRDFSAEYGGNYEVRAGSNLNDMHPGEWPFVLLPSLDDAPGAIAYHTTNGNGMPLLYDGITLSDAINASGNSVSVAISHELLETGGDPGANLWAADEDHNNIYCNEVCDPFENRSYQIGDVWVSDWALRAYFIPGSAGPYSYMTKAGMVAEDAKAPLQTNASLGYQMVNAFNPRTVQQQRTIVLMGALTRRPITHERSRRARRGYGRKE